MLPTAIAGTERLRNWKRLQFPKVTVQYGDPFRFERVPHTTRDQRQAAADEIFSRIKALYAELEAYGRRGMAQRMRELRRAERGAGRAATA